MRRVKVTAPTRWEEARLRRATRAAAKREAGQRRDPHRRASQGGGSSTGEAVGYQLVPATAVSTWINKLAALFRSAQEICLREIQKSADGLAHILVDLDENAALIPPRLKTGDLHRRLVPAVVIAEIVQGAALWPLVDHLPLPLALLAAAAIATANCMLAILTGVCVGALVFFQRDGPHELHPRERLLALAGAVVFGALVLAAAFVLAFARDGWVLWLALALVVAAVEITFGVARYEARHHREREGLRKDCAKVIKEGRGGVVALRQVREAAIGAGRRAVDTGTRVLRDGEVAFDKRWQTIHWNDGEPVPTVPQVELPGESELAERLLVEITPELQRVIDLFADGTAPSSPLPRIAPQPRELPA